MSATANEIANEKAVNFRADLDRAGFPIEDAVILCWAFQKPVDADLTVTEMELLLRFHRVFCSTEAGAP